MLIARLQSNSVMLKCYGAMVGRKVVQTLMFAFKQLVETAGRASHRHHEHRQRQQ